MNCGNCGLPATKLGYRKGIIGDPDSWTDHHYWWCPGCHLQEQDGKWVNAYNELKKIDDQYRREQN